MSEYKLKTGKLGDKVIGTYRKVENAFVDRFLEKDPNAPGVLRMKPGKLGKAVMQGYQTMEDTVVGAYKKVEDAFVDTFLEKTDAEDARETPEAVPGTAAPGEAKGESDPSKLWEESLKERPPGFKFWNGLLHSRVSKSSVYRAFG